MINKYNWEWINVPSDKGDWENIEKNNVTISLNVLYTKKEKIYPAYVSKYNPNHQKKNYSFKNSKSKRIELSCTVNTISIIKRNNVKISRWFLLSELPSLFCQRKQKRESHRKLCENKDFYKILVSFEGAKILEFNQYQNLIKHYLLFTQILNV